MLPGRKIVVTIHFNHTAGSEEEMQALRDFSGVLPDEAWRSLLEQIGVDRIKRMSIEVLSLKGIYLPILRQMGFKKVGDLLRLTRDDIITLNLQNAGIVERLAHFGFTLKARR